MASDAEWAIGDHIEIGDGATPLEAFTEIPELRNIQYNPGTRTRVDTTSHTSTPPYRDNIPTFFEGGQITADGNWLPRNAVHMTLESKLEASAATTFRFVVECDVGGDVVYQGKGYVTSIPRTSNYDDARRKQLVIDLTGAWVRVAGS